MRGGQRFRLLVAQNTPSLFLAAMGNSSHFIALDDVLWGVLQQMPSVPFLVRVCASVSTHTRLCRTDPCACR